MFVSSFKTCLYDVQMLSLYQLNKNYIISVFKSLDEQVFISVLYISI